MLSRISSQAKHDLVTEIRLGCDPDTAAQYRHRVAEADNNLYAAISEAQYVHSRERANQIEEDLSHAGTARSVR